MGTVFFGPDPIPAVKLTLTGDPKVTIDSGDVRRARQFHLSVGPARQIQTLRPGLIHNKKRKSDEDITIEAGPNPKPVKIVLK